MLHNTVKHTLVSGLSAFRLNRPPGCMYSVLVKQTSVSLTIRRRGGVGLGLRGTLHQLAYCRACDHTTAPVLRNLHLRRLTRRHTLWVGFSYCQMFNKVR